VDILNRAGIDAAIVHRKKGFRVTWFKNETQVVYQAKIEPDRQDIIVVPEVFGPRATDLYPLSKKVILNQNAYYTFIGYPLDVHDRTTAYADPNLLAVLVVSEDSKRYLERVFPHLTVQRVRVSANPQQFQFRPLKDKNKLITFMPRKNAEDSRQVINILKFKGLLDEWDVKPIDGMTYYEAAKRYEESSLFFSFGHPEGLGMPPFEAMLTGAIVVGYHGFGGLEYFKRDFCWPVEAGDIMGFVDAAEEALTLFRSDPEAMQRRADAAYEFIKDEVSVEREERDVLEVWTGLLERIRPQLAVPIA
jgi:hypothetical protein